MQSDRKWWASGADITSYTDSVLYIVRHFYLFTYVMHEIV